MAPDTSCYLLDKTCSGCLSASVSPGSTDDNNDSGVGSPYNKQKRQETTTTSSTSSSSSCHYVIRWPSECQVLPYRIRHIKSLPSTPEVFYDPTGMERLILSLNCEYPIFLTNLYKSKQSHKVYILFYDTKETGNKYLSISIKCGVQSSRGVNLTIYKQQPYYTQNVLFPPSPSINSALT